MLRRLFLQHPDSVGESYTQHFLQAMRFAAKMTAGGLACIVHGFIPGLFEKTGSDTVRALHAVMTERQDRGRDPEPASTGKPSA